MKNNKDRQPGEFPGVLLLRMLQAMLLFVLIMLFVTYQAEQSGTHLTGAVLDLPNSLNTTAQLLDMPLTSRGREWFLANPLNHCARHEIPAQGQVNVSPFVNDYTFRSMSDHVFDKSTNPPGAHWRPEHVRQGDIIFVKTDLLLQFFQERHPKIKSTYILITHNSAFSVPMEPRHKCTKDACSRYINDTQLGHWYGKNMMQGYGPKTTPLPVGIPSSNEWYANPLKDKDTLRKIALAAPAWDSRTSSVYINWSNATHGDRKGIVNRLAKLPGVRIVHSKTNYATYLTHMANSMFVAAPRGFGVDTYRAWESIYLGAVPIIQRGPLDWLYEGLPVLVVDSFDQVDQNLLDTYAANRNTLNTQQSTAKAWAVYWYQELQKKQQELRTQQS